MTKRLFAMLASGMAIALLLVMAPNASAAIPEAVPIYLLNRHFGDSDRKCLDADLNTINANGGRVQLWQCNNSQQQQWIAYRNAEGFIVLVNNLSNKCLDANPNTLYNNPAQVYLWECNGSPQQQWNDVDFAPDERLLFFSNRLRLDAALEGDPNAMANNETIVQMWDYNGLPHQIFGWNRL